MLSDNENNVEYRDIPGFPTYRVGSDGSIWSCLRQVHSPGTRGVRFAPSGVWRQMSPATCKQTGYKTVLLSGKSHTGGRAKFNVHTLILTAFVGPCPERYEACHNDGNRGNNAISNLRWGTHTSNMADMEHHGSKQQGQRHYRTKFSDGQILKIRSDYNAGATCKALSSEYGVAYRTMYSIVKKETWKHLNDKNSGRTP